MQVHSEGDSNQSTYRSFWQMENLSEKTRNLLSRDSDVFLHQSLSTPCLNAVSFCEGIYITDLEGHRYMDFHGNSVHQVGYNNPYVLERVRKQLEELSFAPRRYACETAVNLAEELVTEFGGDAKVLFAPGGTEAIGIALKIMRKYTGRYKVVSMWDSFHGASLDAISAGGERGFRMGIGPLMPGDSHIMPYNSYRCIFGSCEECGLKCLDYLEMVIESEGDIGAVLLEPIRATDIQVPSFVYHMRLREICDKYNILLIYDEIPTALGRTGHIYTHQYYNVKPDIAVLGKGLGGAIMPMAAVVANQKLDCGSDIALGHYTHEKSPLGSAAALGVIECIRQENLLPHVFEIEKILRRRLTRIYRKYSIVGDVRVAGAMAAVEIVKNRKKKERDTESAERIMYDCLKHGLSFKISHGSTLTLTPPIIITESQMNEAMDILENAIERLS